MKKTLFLVLFALIGSISRAETIEGPSRVCPGVRYGYILSGLTSNNYKWKITKGKINGQTEVCGNSLKNVNITWDADLGYDGKIEVFKLNDCNSAATLVLSMDVKKFTFPAPSASPCVGLPNLSLACGKAETVMITFLAIGGDYHTYDNNLFYVDKDLDVTVPSGWIVESATTAAAPTSCYGQKATRITVTVKTSGTTAGGVSIRTRSFCSSVILSDWSSPVNFVLNSSTFNPPMSILENQAICNGPGVFSINNPSGYKVQWSASGNIAIVGSSIGNNVSVISDGAYSGSGILTATFSNACGSKSTTKLIGVGAPVITPTYYTANGETRPLGISTNYVDALPGYIHAYFDVTGAAISNVNVVSSSQGGVIWGEVNGTPLELNMEFTDYDQWIVFGITSVNCGISTYHEVGFSGPNSWNVVAYPNPANDQLTIERKVRGRQNPKSINKRDVAILEDSNKLIQLRLLNNQGKVLVSGLIKENNLKYSLNVADIPNGTYYLHIIDGKTILKKQIVIKH